MEYHHPGVGNDRIKGGGGSHSVSFTNENMITSGEGMGEEEWRCSKGEKNDEKGWGRWREGYEEGNGTIRGRGHFFFNAWKINLLLQALQWSSIPLCWIGEVTYPTVLSFPITFLPQDSYQCPLYACTH